MLRITVCDSQATNQYAAGEQERKSLLIKQGKTLRRFAFDDISYIESSGHRIFLHCCNGDCIAFYLQLNEVSELMDDPRFLRCHQSFLVNMDKVQFADDDFVLTDGTRILIKVRERRAMRERYFTYALSKGMSIARSGAPALQIRNKMA